MQVSHETLNDYVVESLDGKVYTDVLEEVEILDNANSPRGYNFRKRNEYKAKKRASQIVNNVNYWPHQPTPIENEDGSTTYFSPNSSSDEYGELKRAANKAVRRTPLEELPSGGSYKKAFDLWNNWF